MRPGRTRSRWRFLVAVSGVALLAAACGGAGSGRGTAGGPGESTTAPSPGTVAPNPSRPPSTAAHLAEWQTLAITDAKGERFSIGELAGRPVFVENFATWCSNCRKQLHDTQAAAARAGDRAVFVALSVETDLDAGDMKDYAAKNGFSDIRFAVMSPEMLAAMSDAYGNSALNPPSTPKVKVAADGAAGKLVTGYESTGEILRGLGLA
jgi:thiol-disulfide isomerase/thioredoxin